MPGGAAIMRAAVVRRGLPDFPYASLVARRLLLPAVLAACLLLAAAAPAAAKPGAKFQAMIDAIVDDPQGPPGVSVLIRNRWGTRYFESGVANVRTGAKPRRLMKMRIASMAKAFSGAVALALVDRGELRLGDTIDEVLPGVWPLAGHIELRQLLNHTAGLPDYIRDPEFIAVFQSDPARYLPPEDLIGFVSDQPPEPPGGGRYEYSDSDNIIIGLMAEEVTGRSYESLLRRFVYRPADLENTSLPRTIEMPKPYLRGYGLPENGAREDVSELINPALAGASGGIVSTPTDVGRFFRAYLGGELFDKRLRQQQLADEIRGESSPPGPGVNYSGLGVFRYRTGCGQAWGHTGSFPGYRLFAASDRSGERSVVFAVNTQIVPPDQGSQQVSDAIRSTQRRAVCMMKRVR